MCVQFSIFGKNILIIIYIWNDSGPNITEQECNGVRCNDKNVCRLGYVDQNAVNCTGKTDCQDVWIVERPESAPQNGTILWGLIFGELQ